MEQRTLGRTGVKVSAFCLGAMMFGDWGNTDHDDCVRIIHRAIDGGIDFIDTADVYAGGESEEIVGKALKGHRDEVFLATKVHGVMGKQPRQQGTSRHWIMEEVESSLRRLDVDHIDLYQVHRPDLSVDLEETLGALTDLVRQGKVRYIGCSTFPGWMVVQSQWVSERRGLERFVTEQPPYSIFHRHVEDVLFPVTQRYGMGVIVWSPLAAGWLTGKYRRDEPYPEGSRGDISSKKWSGPPARRFDVTRADVRRKFDLIDRLRPIAEEAGISLTHMAVAFTLAHPAVTSAIIGPRSMEQLDDLLEGADVRLDPATLDAIDQVVPPGTLVVHDERGWDPPWLEAPARRR
jgi:aryl-alcohol dehydrogenase (NADP+)